ncbi:TPA: ead/Ea22-like family protein [Escherichia coli]|nr:ead/Ea22-like family protein [Escherichia coli]
MSNIDKQALRGQSVEGSYYLAECGHCGEMYPSNKLDGGESLFSGDYGECFCHLCGADDSDIADNGAWGSEAVTAWNYQQKRIEALLDELEKMQAQSSKWCEAFHKAVSVGARYEERIAELEAREISLTERSSMLHRTDFHEDYQTVMAYKVSEVIAAIRAAGIRIKGE